MFRTSLTWRSKLLGIPSSFDLHVKEVRNIDPIRISEVKDVEIEHVKDVEIERIRHIAPLAAHIKEINHIDPLSVDAFNVTEVRNIDPIRVPQFNVTNLPQVNVVLRQLPAIDLNVRRLPPVSVGLHQNFHVPSDYQVRLQFMGLEFFRIAVHGQTHLIPCDKARREQARTHERSFPQPAAAGNPAIPSHQREVRTTARQPCHGSIHYSPGGPAAGSLARPAAASAAAEAGLNPGHPPMTFSLATERDGKGPQGSSISSRG